MTEWITSSAPYLAPAAPGGLDPWQREAAQAGGVGRHRVVSVERCPAPDLVAARLRTAPGDPAIRRRRLVTLDDRPVEVADSWYPPAVADGTALAEAGPIRGGAVRALAELGYRAVRHIEEVSLSVPPPDVAALLGAAPVLLLVRTSLTAAEVACEVAVMHMSAEAAPGVPRRLRYELRSA